MKMVHGIHLVRDHFFSASHSLFLAPVSMLNITIYTGLGLTLVAPNMLIHTIKKKKNLIYICAYSRLYWIYKLSETAIVIHKYLFFFFFFKSA